MTTRPDPTRGRPRNDDPVITVIVAHLEEHGDVYDLRYSASIRRLAEDLAEALRDD